MVNGIAEHMINIFSISYNQHRIITTNTQKVIITTNTQKVIITTNTQKGYEIKCINITVPPTTKTIQKTQLRGPREIIGVSSSEDRSALFVLSNVSNHLL